MLRFPCQDYLNYLKNIKGFKKVNTISEWIRNPNTTFYLKPDGRTYGYKFGSTLRLFSYNTLVCEFSLDDLELIIHGWWSNTTQKHQYAFIDYVTRLFGVDYSPIYKDENIKSAKGFLETIKAIRFRENRYATHKTIVVNGGNIHYFWRI